MSKILDGIALRDTIILELKATLSKRLLKPTLVIIQIGSLKESNLYIKKKKDFAKEIDAMVVHKKYKETVTEKQIIADIEQYNADKNIQGIMVQLPIPKHLDTDKILETIEYKKDVDGLTSRSMKLLFDNTPGFIPATTQGIITLLDQNNVNLVGKKVVIVGDSSLVGRPTALAFLNRKATVTICHIDTKNLQEETKVADILIVAVGHPDLITEEYVSAGQVIIDVGITIVNKKVRGDVDYNKVKDVVAMITPVPGGVGPMTVCSLFQNLVKVE